MNDFINVIRKDTQIRYKIIDMLDRYSRLACNYQFMMGCDSLSQNLIFTELINLMATTIVDIDIELKMKISRIKYLENRLF